MERKIIKFKTICGDELEGVFIPLSANSVIKMGEVIREVRKDVRKKISDPTFDQNEQYVESLVKLLDKPRLVDLIISSQNAELENEAKLLILTPVDEDGYQDKLKEKIEAVKEEKRKELFENEEDNLRIEAKSVMINGIEQSYVLKPTYDFIIYKCLRNPKELTETIFTSAENVGDLVEGTIYDVLIREWIEFSKNRGDEEAKK